MPEIRKLFEEEVDNPIPDPDKKVLALCEKVAEEEVSSPVLDLHKKVLMIW